MSKGSHATFGGWEPKLCAICGEKIVLSRQSCRFSINHKGTEGPRSVHVECERIGGAADG
jgi:hypothetical protein